MSERCDVCRKEAYPLRGVTVRIDYNFGPIMATASECTIAQVQEVVPLGDLDPENIVTPGIFVRHVVKI